jgi:Tfp pilus assembly protein PilN
VIRQPDFATRSALRRVPSWEGALAAIGMLALIASSAAAWRARDEARAAERRVADVRRDVERQTADLKTLASRRAGRALSRAAAEASPARIVAGLAAALPADVRLDRLAIDYAHGAVLEMNVDARSARSWDELLDRLEHSAAFAEVVPGPESRDDGVRTTIRARWSAGSR